jgi:hypothetical protein
LIATLGQRLNLQRILSFAFFFIDRSVKAVHLWLMT